MHERKDYLRKPVVKFVWLKLSLEIRLSISGFCLTALEKKSKVHIMESLGLRQSKQTAFTACSRYDIRIHTDRLLLYLTVCSTFVKKITYSDLENGVGLTISIQFVCSLRHVNNIKPLNFHHQPWLWLLGLLGGPHFATGPFKGCDVQPGFQFSPALRE